MHALLLVRRAPPPASRSRTPRAPTSGRSCRRRPPRWRARRRSSRRRASRTARRRCASPSRSSARARTAPRRTGRSRSRCSTKTTCFDFRLFSSGSKSCRRHVRPRQVELRHLAVERAVPDQDDRTPRRPAPRLRRQRVERLDLLLRRLAVAACVVRLLSSVDDVILGDAQLRPTPIDERRAQRLNSSPCSGSPASPTTIAQVRRSAPRRRRPARAAATRTASTSALTVVSSRASARRSAITRAPRRAGRPHSAQMSADERQQHDRHVPELALFDRGHAAAGVLQILGQRRHRLRRIEPAAGVLARSASAAARASSRRSTRRRSARRARARPPVPSGLPARVRFDASPAYHPFARRSGTWRGTGRCARRSTASARRPSCPDGPVTCATTRASFSSTNARIDDVGGERDRLAGLDAIGQRVRRLDRRRARRPRASAAADARSSRASGPRGASSRPSASATSPAPGRRATCRGRSAAYASTTLLALAVVGADEQHRRARLDRCRSG